MVLLARIIGVTIGFVAQLLYASLVRLLTSERFRLTLALLAGSAATLLLLFTR